MAPDASHSGPFGPIIAEIGKVTAAVAVLVAYVAALLGQSGPLPRTTAFLTLLLTLALFWWLGLKDITKQKRRSRRREHVPRAASRGLLHRLKQLFLHLLEPVRDPSSQLYARSLGRRRAEALGLILVTIVAIIRFPAVLTAMLDEFHGVPAMNCIGSYKRVPLRVLIADFARAPGVEILNEEDSLYDQFHSTMRQNMAVCRAKVAVSNRTEAQSLGKKTQASILIWGRIDGSSHLVGLEVANWDASNALTTPQPAAQMNDFTFQQCQPIEIAFLTQFTLAQLLYLDHHVQQARNLLDQALKEAASRQCDQDLANGYFFMGLLLDDPSSPDHDLLKAIEAYSTALSLDREFYPAYLNRAFDYEALNQTDLALADYTTLINSGSALAGTAYASRALLQPTQDLAEQDLEQAIRLTPLDGYVTRGRVRLGQWLEPAGAVADFQQAVQLAPAEPDRYHDLGQAQLAAGQLAAALEAYDKAIPLMSKQDRDQYVEDLSALAEIYPNTEASIPPVIAKLRAARLP